MVAASCQPGSAVPRDRDGVKPGEFVCLEKWPVGQSMVFEDVDGLLRRLRPTGIDVPHMNPQPSGGFTDGPVPLDGLGGDLLPGVGDAGRVVFTPCIQRLLF